MEWVSTVQIILTREGGEMLAQLSFLTTVQYLSQLCEAIHLRIALVWPMGGFPNKLCRFDSSSYGGCNLIPTIC